MTNRRYAAFLRGVSPMNLKMPDLKTCFERCGFTDVKTLLSSGNVTFTARAAAEASLERRIEAALRKDLGRDFLTFVRSLEALRELLGAAPYAPFPPAAGAKRVITFLRDRQAASRTLALPVELHGARILCRRGTEVFSDYVSTPRGPVFMNLLQKTFGQAITTRTWATVGKVAGSPSLALSVASPTPARKRRP